MRLKKKLLKAISHKLRGLNAHPMSAVYNEDKQINLAFRESKRSCILAGNQTIKARTHSNSTKSALREAERGVKSVSNSSSNFKPIIRGDGVRGVERDLYKKRRA